MLENYIKLYVYVQVGQHRHLGMPETPSMISVEFAQTAVRFSPWEKLEKYKRLYVLVLQRVFYANYGNYKERGST